MEIHTLHIGSLVHPVEPAAMASLCPTFHPGVTTGVVVGLNPHTPNAVELRWLDVRGPQTVVYTVHPAQLAPAPPRRRWPRRHAASHNATGHHPPLQIRHVTVTPEHISFASSGLTFHTVADANAALREIRAAREPYKPKIRRDRRNAIHGALLVVTHLPERIDIYRIEPRATATPETR